MLDIHMVTAESELQSAKDVAIAFTVVALGGIVCIGVVLFFRGVLG